MQNESWIRNRLERIEHQLLQTNILLLVLIAICLLGFTGKLIFVLVVFFWLGLIIGFIYLVVAIIDNITAKNAQKRMDEKLHDLIEKAKAEQET